MIRAPFRSILFIPTFIGGGGKQKYTNKQNLKVLIPHTTDGHGCCLAAFNIDVVGRCIFVKKSLAQEKRVEKE